MMSEAPINLKEPIYLKIPFNIPGTDMDGVTSPLFIATE